MRPEAAYLRLVQEDWPGCLDDSLAWIRSSWHGNWVGLPQLLARCAEFLGLHASPLSSDSQVLLDAALEVARLVEQQAACGVLEPAYHNRLHFADSLTAITVQTAIESAQWGIDEPDWKAALLLLAVAHDYQHPGKVNTCVSELEHLTMEALKPVLRSHDVPPDWVERIETLVLRTDFALVPENHQRVHGLPFSWCTDWATVLLNEADTLASSSERFGPALGLALAAEWQAIAFPAHAVVATAQGRRGFLEHIRFSSCSAGVLGAPQWVQRQLGALARQ
jgi:hypothetical protein